MSPIADKLDAIDYKILKLLQEDGRMTDLELSDQIGLSPAPTLERVKKLEEFKIGVSVFIQISLNRQVENVIKFKERIEHIPEMMECYQVTGNADDLLKVLVTDNPAFKKLIASTFNKMEETGNLQTMLIISDVKQWRALPLKCES